MIELNVTAFVSPSTQMDSQLRSHQGAEVITGDLANIQAHHLKKFLWYGLNLLENLNYFRYSDFYVHGVSPFFLGFGQNQFKEVRLFCHPMNSHN